MKKFLVVILCISILMTGCLGSTPRIVESYQYGDDKKGCDILEAEIAECEAKITERRGHRSGKIATNIVMGITGAVLFWPALFLIDARSDELAEIDGLAKRRESLGRIAVNKECEFCLGSDYARNSYLSPEEIKILDQIVEEQSDVDEMYRGMN